jgi:hypothetical protein
MRNDAAVAIVGKQEMSFECFSPQTAQEEAKRKVLFPYWAICHIATIDFDLLDEIERTHTVAGEVTL